MLSREDHSNHLFHEVIYHKNSTRSTQTNTGHRYERQEESEYVLKFENEEEEEEKDGWQIRLERFQDEESMMIMDRVIQDGAESFGLNINTHETLSKRMEKDRELLKQGNPRTKHECEKKHHESDEFASKMLSRREQIDRELREDVELMETHGDSLRDFENIPMRKRKEWNESRS